MRTLLLVLLGLALATAVAFWVRSRADRRPAAIGFTVAWLAVTAWNLAVGMSHGYGLVEELPYQAVIFALPVGAIWALTTWWPRR